MEEFKLIANKALTATEAILYTNTSGAIIKTILLHNTGSTDKEATLNLDGVAFKFKLAALETKIIGSPILSKSIKALGEGINIHITGLQL